ncbi:MAG: hypothetical protein LBP98_05430 [Tannerella sp.]|nr:hypothetical protein [Tannerella sp.]
MFAIPFHGKTIACLYYFQKRLLFPLVVCLHYFRKRLLFPPVVCLYYLQKRLYPPPVVCLYYFRKRLHFSPVVCLYYLQKRLYFPPVAGCLSNYYSGSGFHCFRTIPGGLMNGNYKLHFELSELASDYCIPC